MVLNRILVNGNGLQWGFETGASSERLVSVAGARLVKVLRVGPLVFWQFEEDLRSPTSQFAEKLIILDSK